VAALLHDGGAFAVVLADDDQRAALDAAEARLASASEATLVPTVDLKVTAPRIG
jgi:hypothetical protein